MALGAKPGQVLKLFLKQGVFLVFAGSVAGLGLALGATRLLASYLFGVRPFDPATLDRKSTRLNSSHGYISYAVFCLKKKINKEASKLINSILQECRCSTRVLTFS